jgi:K+-sensing histidine kinase KdpD
MVTSMWSTWQRERRRELPFEPTERQPLGAARTRLAYIAAIVTPLAVGALMIPLRDELDQSTALILVVPVLLVALAGGIGPGLLAALSATMTFDVLLTRPYFGFAIHGDDDVVAAVTLLIVGAIVGTVASRLARVDTRAGARRRSISQFPSVVHAVADGTADDRTIIDDAATAVTDILGLSGCEWRTGKASTTAPLILPDGHLMAYLSDLSEDRAQLPDHTELPVSAGDTDHGRFVLLPTRGHDVSIEERRAAAAVAQLLAHELSLRMMRRGGVTAVR